MRVDISRWGDLHNYTWAIIWVNTIPHYIDTTTILPRYEDSLQIIDKNDIKTK